MEWGGGERQKIAFAALAFGPALSQKKTVRHGAMKPTGMILALGLVSAAWGDEPAPPATRLGIHFEPQAPAVSDNPILNPPAPPAGVVELPRFDVKEMPLRIDADELLTAHGQLDDAKRRFISPLYAKTFGPLAQLGAYYLDFFSILGGWHPNDLEALVLYDQDRRLKRMQDFNDLIAVSKVASPDEARELLDLRNESFRRDQPSAPEGAHPLCIFRRGPSRP